MGNEIIALRGGDDAVDLSVSQQVIIVGANGSGKTRLGVWLEFEGPQQKRARRIGAQRPLILPTEVSPRSVTLERAVFLQKAYNLDEAQRFDGSYQELRAARLGRMWKDNPSIKPFDDFKELMAFLFAEYHDVATQYFEESRRSADRLTPPQTLLVQAQLIWESVLPHRNLKIRGGSIEATLEILGRTYNAAEMSDGERVALYLIWQCLAVEQNTILVIDEPELHLHRAIQAPLWNALEAARPDCMFVYLTHDLEFAASRALATRIWVRAFDGERWEWDVIFPESELPQDVLLSILGSRKPILFIEGQRGSIEAEIYDAAFPGMHIEPRGSSEQVIAATSAFRALKPMHGLDCMGIIDRDFRDEAECERLEKLSVHALAQHEFECVLLHEDVLFQVAKRANASHLTRTDPSEIVTRVIEVVFESVVSTFEATVSRATAWEVERALRLWNARAKGLEMLKEAVESVVQSIDVQEIYARHSASLTGILEGRSYPLVLRYTTSKGLVRRIGGHFGLPHAEYASYVARLVRTPDGADLLGALRAALPPLQTVK